MGHLKFIHFLTPGLTLKRKENQLSVFKDDKKLQGFPLTVFDGIYLYGKVEIKNSLINFLLSNNKYIVFLSPTGLYKGILLPAGIQSNINPRIRQYSIYSSKEEALEFSKRIILIKIQEIEKCFGINLKNSKNALVKATSINSLLGIEGYASNYMFDELKRLLRKIGIRFSSRSYNPPEDEPNALLSTFYMHFYNSLIPEVYSAGLDPFLGILHKKRGKHYSFVSDLMELIRPFITYNFYLFLKENGGISDITFSYRNKGVYLEADELKKILIYIDRMFYEDGIRKVREFMKSI
ncbi:CRISPR-associated endonuclease Cas1 [Persephonella sp.]